MVVKNKKVFNQYSLKPVGKENYLILNKGEVYRPDEQVSFPLANAVQLIRWYEQADKSAIAAYVSAHMAHWIL